MSCSCNANSNETIKFIQGDTFSLNITFSGDAKDEISAVEFSSRGLNITKNLTKSDDLWILTLTAEETAALKPIKADYDLTLTFNDGSTYTAIYKSPVMVERKINKVEGE